MNDNCATNPIPFDNDLYQTFNININGVVKTLSIPVQVESETNNTTDIASRQNFEALPNNDALNMLNATPKTNVCQPNKERPFFYAISPEKELPNESSSGPTKTKRRKTRPTKKSSKKIDKKATKSKDEILKRIDKSIESNGKALSNPACNINSYKNSGSSTEVVNDTEAEGSSPLRNLDWLLIPCSVLEMNVNNDGILHQDNQTVKNNTSQALNIPEKPTSQQEQNLQNGKPKEPYQLVLSPKEYQQLLQETTTGKTTTLQFVDNKSGMEKRVAFCMKNGKLHAESIAPEKYEAMQHVQTTSNSSHVFAVTEFKPSDVGENKSPYYQKETQNYLAQPSSKKIIEQSTQSLRATSTFVETNDVISSTTPNIFYENESFLSSKQQTFNDSSVYLRPSYSTVDEFHQGAKCHNTENKRNALDQIAEAIKKFKTGSYFSDIHKPKKPEYNNNVKVVQSNVFQSSVYRISHENVRSGQSQHDFSKNFKNPNGQEDKIAKLKEQLKLQCMALENAKQAVKNSKRTLLMLDNDVVID